MRVDESSAVETWSDADYRRLLAEVDSIFQSKPGTPEGDRLDKLADLIEAYEEERYSISAWLASHDAVVRDSSEKFPVVR